MAPGVELVVEGLGHDLMRCALRPGVQAQHRGLGAKHADKGVGVGGAKHVILLVSSFIGCVVLEEQIGAPCNKIQACKAGATHEHVRSVTL